MNSLFQSQLAPFVERYQTLKSSKKNRNADASVEKARTTRPNDFTQAVLKQLRADMDAWLASPHGKERMAQVAHMGLGGRIKVLKELASSSAFEKTIALIKTQPSRDSEQSINAVSIAFEAQATAIIGVSGSVGVAFDPYDQLADLTVFACVAAVEGKVGVASGTQCGVWTCAPSGVAGVSFGAQATLQLNVFGGSVAISVSTSGVGFLLTFGVGLELGAALMQWFTWILWNSSYDLPPFAQPEASHFLILTRLYCENISGGDGNNNEVYFEFTANDKLYFRYPTWSYFPMAEGDTWYCGRSAYLVDWLDVYLYDVDDTSGNDLLGSAHIICDELTVGEEKKYELKSMNGLDERKYYLYAKLIY